MRNLALVAMVLAAFSMAACQNMQSRGNKEVLGGATGAVLGGLAGSKIGGGSGQLWATGAGALLGALAGSNIGRSLDRADKAYAGEANMEARDAQIGEQIRWNNPETGNYGSVTPVRDGYSSSGRYCREFQQTIVVGGQEERAYGTACQLPDGSWEIVG